uniref:Protein yellow n=1 Tax=Anopheles maculatus TaxID=74869 RepID=A0A182SKC0_9DIPT
MRPILLTATCALALFLIDPGDGLLRVILDFDRWEVNNGSAFFNMEKFRVRKFNRTISVMNGTGVLLVDLDNRYSYGVHFARSAQGNNQFNAYPMKLAAKPFCDFINVYYREYQHLFLKNTNLPFVPPEGLCPFPNGTYWAKDLHLDSSVIPVVVPEGLWRCTTDLVDTHSDGLMKVIIDFNHWDLINGTDILSMESVRVRKYNRTMSVLNGTITFLVDLDNTYEYGFNFARSAQGNNQYHAYPMKIASKPICDFLATYYREFQEQFLKFSNLPHVPEEGLCPFPKGKYWVKDAYVDSSLIPIVIPEGYWKASPELRIVKTGELVATGSFYVKLTKELV